MSLRRRALFLAGLFVAVSCSDAGNPLEPGPKPQPGPVDALQVLQCSVNIPTGAMHCAPPGANAGGASASGQIFTGGQNKYVALTASNFASTANSLEMDVTVKSLMRQPLGTDDGVTLHPNGVRVWFAEDPVAQPTGTVTVDLESGTDILLVNPQPYFQYNTILQTNQTSGVKRWRFDFAGGATNIAFKVYVVAHVQYENGWVEVTPPLDTLAPTETVDLNGIAYDVRADSAPVVSQTLTWSTNAPGVATVDAGTGLVTAVAAGTATITATNGAQSGTATIVVNTNPFVAVDTFPAITNVTIPEPAPGLLKNPNDGDGQTVTVVPDTVTTSQGGTAWLNADGSLEYLSKAGFSGEDIIPFEITDGVTRRPAHAVVQVAPSNYWYVRSGGTGDGRDRFPLGTLAQAQDSAAAGDSILVLDNGVLTVSGPVTLEANQAILGQGIPTSIVRTVNEQAVTILAAGTQPELTSATGSTVTLGTDNVIKGVAIASTAGAAGITGTSFGTLKLWYSNIGTAGPAVVLSDGALDADSTVTISSTGSPASGISLANVTGSMTTTGGAISGAAAAAFSVAGGSVSVNYGGNVTQGNNAALVAVTGGHNGSMTFPGTLSATAGTGLQFNDADGSYSFPGTATLNGGDAGVDITNGSDGGIALGPNVSVTNPSGSALTVYGSSPTLTYSGSLTKENAGLLVEVGEQPGGSLVFTGTLNATAGDGISFSNADGDAEISAVTTLNGGNARLAVVNGSSGTINFMNNTNITTATTTALHVANGGSATDLTYGGGISTSGSGRPAHVEGVSGGTVLVSGNVTSTGLGIEVVTNTGGTIAFDGSSKSLTTGTNPAVTATGNTGATVRFGGGGLAITTTSGTGFGAATGGDVQVTGAGNSISTGTGTGLSLNGVGTSASGVLFASVSTGAAANGIALNNLTGVGVTVGGGTISNTTGHGVSLTNLGSLTTGVVLNNLSVTTGAAGISPLFGTTFGTLSVGSTALSATGGPALSLTTGALSATFSSLSSSGTNGNGVSLTGVTGTLNANAGSIAGGAAGPAFSVNAGTVGGTIASSLSQAGNAALVAIVGGHGTGTLTFTGGVSANNGTGLQFTDADGTYTFTGTTNLAGGDAGIDIAAASAGTVNVTPSGGNTAAVTSPSGIAIAILGGSADLNYSGNVTQANAQPLLSVSGGHNGDVSFPSGTLNASNGTGLQFDNSDGTYVFGGTVTMNGGSAGIDVTNGSGGTFTFPVTASITSPATGNLVSILNSAPNFTYSGSLTKANNNVTGILVQSNTGGTITFNGDGTTADSDPADVTKSINSGTAAAVSLVSNTNATINFNGGGLGITSGSGAGFNATGGGTVNVTGATNVVNSGTGTAVNVQNTTIGASGLSFQSVSHSGGANGIVLDNTGSTNGFQVTGLASGVGSGGSITNTTGGDGTTQGTGIYLNNTRAVSIAFMALSGHANWAIRGSGVVGFTMNKTRITGTNGTTTANDEGSMYFTELTGSASITGSFIDGGFEDAVLVDNSTGTLNRIVFDGDTIGSSSGISGDGMRLEASAGTLNATIQNTRFARAAGDMFQHNIIGTAQSDLIFLNNTMINGHPAISGGGGGVTITAAESGDLTYDINGNTVRGAKGTALLLNKPFGGLPGNGTMSGHIRNNVVGTVGAGVTGSTEGSGIEVGLLAQGTHTTLIQNNQVYDYANMGIFVNLGGTSQSVTGLTHNGTLNATVRGNTVAEPIAPAGGFAQNGLHLNAGTNSTGGNDAYLVCLDVGDGAVAANRNTFNGSGALGGQDIRLRQRFATTVRLPGYGGANNNDAAVQTYVLNRNNNPGSTTAVAANTVPTGGGYVNPGASCPQPS
ncbi:MAG TPA: Ig-like domain-containing protein [Longimicrobium sp.]